MKSILSLTAATMLFATSAFAVTIATETQSVGGATGLADYSLEVIGANGLTYACRPDIVTIDGVTARQCVRPEAAGGDLFEGGLTASVGGAILGVVLLAALISNDDATATTTTD